MENITDEYLPFYCQGRAERRLLKHDISESDLVEVISKGTPLRRAIEEACERVATPFQTGKSKRLWLLENADDVAGLDPDLAYKAFLQGRIDELAYVLEPDVVGALGEDEDGEDEDGEEEEEAIEDDED